MFEGIILGVIQGIAEWIPVSSEGMLVLAQAYLFEGQSLRDMVELALFLHLGTLLAALLYFRDEVIRVVKTLFSYKKASSKDRTLTKFLGVTTIITAFVGLLFLAAIDGATSVDLATTGRFAMGFIGFLLLITSGMYFWGARQVRGIKKMEVASMNDMTIMGVAQGFAVLPGLSRSGLTIAALLVRGYSEEETLRLSFLMSIPVVLMGNVILNLFTSFSITETALVGLFVAFIVGLLTIHGLFKLARRVNFGYFVLFFGLLTILASFV